MASMSNSLARAILQGEGLMRNEIEQLCIIWLRSDPPIENKMHNHGWQLIKSKSAGYPFYVCSCGQARAQTEEEYYASLG